MERDLQRGGKLSVANERVTENIVRAHFAQHALLGQRIEEQTSTIPAIRKALSEASKIGAGVGKPEFIVSFSDSPRLVIVVECKADVRAHRSKSGNQPDGYAVDGVLHYCRHLSRSFDVIGIAVSGTSPDGLVVSTFRQLRATPEPEELLSPHGAVTHLVPLAVYRELLTYDPAVRARTEAELISFSRVLHNYMRDYAKLAESEKPLVVSGILLALRDEAFKTTWFAYSPRHLARELYSAIDRVARDSDIAEQKREVMLAPYSFLRTHPEISRLNSAGETPLYRLINDLDGHVRPFLEAYHNIDVIGQFYGEFLRTQVAIRRASVSFSRRVISPSSSLVLQTLGQTTRSLTRVLVPAAS